MNIESNSAGPTNGSGTKSFGFVLVIVAVAAAVLAMIIRGPVARTSLQGQPAPPIEAAGWLNGPGPTPEELHGKVIVLDAWAYWCGPCIAKAPELVALHEKYREQGVVFLGLTIEGEDVDPYNRRFLDVTRITWPNGYGAVKTLEALQADTIPRCWVIDRKYNVIWTESSREKISTAIERALAESP